MKKEEQTRLINEQWSIIRDREAKLSSMDYKNTKNGEAERVGQPLPYDPMEIYNINQNYRKDINDAYDEIARLEAIEIEPDEEEIE
mgnify:CR=1 FL=1